MRQKYLLPERAAAFREFSDKCGLLRPVWRSILRTMIATPERPAVLKRQVKSALLEILSERPDLLREALEHIGLGRAIQEGLKTRTVSRVEVFALLRRKRP